MTDGPNDSWLTHARGCAQLIQLRGPSRHTNDFDRALLHAEEGLIVSGAINSSAGSNHISAGQRRNNAAPALFLELSNLARSSGFPFS